MHDKTATSRVLAGGELKKILMRSCGFVGKCLDISNMRQLLNKTFQMLKLLKLFSKNENEN